MTKKIFLSLCLILCSVPTYSMRMTKEFETAFNNWEKSTLSTNLNTWYELVDTLNKMPVQDRQNIPYNLTQQRPPAFMALYDKIDNAIGDGEWDCCCFGKPTNKECCSQLAFSCIAGGGLLSFVNFIAEFGAPSPQIMGASVPLIACGLCNTAAFYAESHAYKIKLWREKMKQHETLATLLSRAPKQKIMKAD